MGAGRAIGASGYVSRGSVIGRGYGRPVANIAYGRSGAFTPRPGLRQPGWNTGWNRWDHGRRWNRWNRWGWGPAFAVGVGGWGWDTWDYGWDYPGYYYDSGPAYASGYLGAYCATPARTCQLYEPAPVGIGCSCSGGRYRGTVVP